MHGIVYAKGAKFQSAKKKSCTFVLFFHRSDPNIQSISACHVLNERKQIFDQIYNLLFLVEFYLESYDQINLLVSCFFCTL